MRAREAREREERDRKNNERAKIVRADREKGGGWRPIETMPFDAYGEGYHAEETTVLVTDGEDVAVTRIHKRFGRPIKQIEPPKMVLTDDGPVYAGGKYEEYDWPQWMFDWEFTDELSSDDERWGKDEIDFIPTHYMPLPLPPKSDNEKEPTEPERQDRR